MKLIPAPTTNGHAAATVVVARAPKRKALPAPAPQRPETLMQAIMQAASDSTVDVGKVAALVELHKTLQAREWERLFNEAMADCQAALEPVRKNQSNTQTNSRYADLSRLAESALPIIHQHGFAIGFGELVAVAKQGHIGVAVRISHRGGHTERSEFHVPLDVCGFKGTANKTAIHGWGSSLTYCRRYSLLCAFNIIVAGDDDGTAASGQPKSSAQLKRDGEWPRFEGEMRACTSMDGLHKCWQRWQGRMNFWRPAWRESAVNLKEHCKECLGGTVQALRESAAALDAHSLDQLTPRPPSPRQVQLTRNALHWEEDITDDEKRACHWPKPPKPRNG